VAMGGDVLVHSRGDGQGVVADSVPVPPAKVLSDGGGVGMPLKTMRSWR
jgi:hypothetical protein